MAEDNTRVYDGPSEDEVLAGPIVGSKGFNPDEVALLNGMLANGRLGLTSLVIPGINELLGDAIIAEMAEEINSARGVSVFAVADKFAMRYMFERVFTGLPDDLKSAAKAVLEHTNFALVPKDSMAAFQALAHCKQGVSRMLILYMLKNCVEGEDRGFNAVETAELVHGAEIADAMDEMYVRWERMNHSIPNTSERLGQGFKSPWHFVQMSDGQHQEVSYREIFEDQYRIIDGALQTLISDLTHCADDPELAGSVQSKLNYYTAIRDVLLETDPAKLPDLWKKSDVAYVHQGGRFIVSLFPETGYATNETGAIPEYFLRMRWSEHPASRMAKSAERQIVEDLPAFAAGKRGVFEGIKRVKDSGHPEISYFAVRSGLELIFEIAGQNLPNDPDVRNKEGFLGTVSPDVMGKRMVESKELFRKFFGSVSHKLLSLVSDDAVLADVIVHEMGHNFGSANHFSGSFEKNCLEEWKASALECVLRKLQMDELSTDELAGIFVADVCQTLRYCQKRESASQALYYGAYKFFMKTAQEVGLISFDEEGRWQFNLEREKLVAYTDAVAAQWLSVQDLYDSGRNEDLLAFAGDSVMADTELTRDMEQRMAHGL